MKVIAQGEGMDFESALNYLFSANDLGIRPGLERIRELMNRLGNPEEDYEIIHIAGTNGKGSVSSYCAHIAAEANKKTGWFTSPYLENFNERIRVIDGKKGLAAFQKNFRSPEISDADFAGLMTDIRLVIEDMKKEGYQMPTVFEMLTACALLHFSREKVELAVLEVGLGGRLDSTNVIKNSLVSVISSLGYDHTDRLGKTLAEIAGEKAGIIKEGSHLVLYDPCDVVEAGEEGQKAKEAVLAMAEKKGASLQVVSKSMISDHTFDRKKQIFRYDNKQWEISLRGEFQVLNAAVAIEACRRFTDDKTIQQGLLQTVWPGRLEILREEPLLMIDGAHNVQGCAALARELERDYNNEDIIYLCGILGDKEHEKMLRLVLSGGTRKPYAIYCTEAPVPRTMSASDLAKELAEILEVEEANLWNIDAGPEGAPQNIKPMIAYSADMEKAFSKAFSQANEEQKALVAFGSLYLIGNLRPIIRRELGKSVK